MRNIKVTYRAVFEQPIGVLNPMNLKLPGPCPVEVFGAADRWRVREIATVERRVYEKLGAFPSADAAKVVCQEAFQRQTELWQMWGTPPTEVGPAKTERLIVRAEVQIMTDGRVLWREPEDYTHILHAPTIDPKAKVPPAACGAKVPANRFISTKANLEPTCTECAEVWRVHYKDKTA